MEVIFDIKSKVLKGFASFLIRTKSSQLENDNVQSREKYNDQNDW